MVGVVLGRLMGRSWAKQEVVCGIKTVHAKILSPFSLTDTSPEAPQSDVRRRPIGDQAQHAILTYLSQEF